MVNLKMNDETATYSDNVQMYLVTILRKRQGENPVPLPDLADELSISTASVHEMSRKLQDQGLLAYQPYAGVSLTSKGEQLARLILRKHRLWEVFLVNALDYDFQTAHETACLLEHATPPDLADRLESYLDRPLVNPQGEPIPYPGEGAEISTEIALSLLSPGEKAVVSSLGGGEAVETFLKNHEIKPGGTVQVLASGNDSLLVRVQSQQTVVTRDIAEEIYVRPRI